MSRKYQIQAVLAKIGGVKKSKVVYCFAENLKVKHGSLTNS